MAGRAGGKSSAIALSDLVALNDEIAALTRAGVPLELGLAAMGNDLPGRLGELAQRLAGRLNQGASLSQALAAVGSQLPPSYRAVVEAGLRSGRLAVALEGLSATARRLVELRRLTGLALLYPLLVVLIAWQLFCFYVAKVSLGYESIPESADAPLAIVAALRPWLFVVGPIVPIMIVAVATFWWFGSQSTLLGRQRGLWRWLPARAQLQACGRAATLSEMLALLVEHEVPLPEAITLAASSSGDARFQSASMELAVALQAGQPLENCRPLLAAFPPLVSWLLVTSRAPATLAAGLHRAADSYERQAQRVSEWARVALPVLFTIALGATVTFAYVVFLFSPYVNLLWKMTAHNLR